MFHHIQHKSSIRISCLAIGYVILKMNLFLRFKLLWLFGIFPPFLLFIFSLNLKLQQLICVLQMDQTLHSKAGLQLPTALSRAFDHLC